ncbi:MAG: hypothetical protein OXC60_16095, partial [Litoreibacter sp.]|nr:hypothetical protein [Litoreibacter sp.]
VAKVRIEAPVKGESHRKTATPRTYSRARLSLTLLSRLNAVSPLEADPADIAVALRLPAGIGIQSGSAILSLSAERADTGARSTAAYTLASQVAADGSRIYAVAQSDWDAFRAQQAMINGWESEAPDDTNGSLSVALGGCRTATAVAPDATLDISIRTEEGGSFLPLVRQAKLARVFNITGITELPPCDQSRAM